MFHILSPILYSTLLSDISLPMNIVPLHLFSTHAFNPCLEMNINNHLNSHQPHIINALFPVEFSLHYFLFFRFLNPICKNNFSKINWFEINLPLAHQCLRWVKELALWSWERETSTSYNTQKSRPCILPGQCNRVDPISAGVGGPAPKLWAWENCMHYPPSCGGKGRGELLCPAYTSIPGAVGVPALWS